MFFDINEVLPLTEIEAMPLEEAQDYILKAKTQFSTLSLIKHWKTNSKYVYGKIYKKYNIPTSGHMIRVKNQTKWQEENEMKLKAMLKQDGLDLENIKAEGPEQIVADNKLEDMVDGASKLIMPTSQANIVQYLNSYFASEKICSFSSSEDGLVIVLGSGSKIKIGPLSNSKIKLDAEMAAVFSL